MTTGTQKWSGTHTGIPPYSVPLLYRFNDQISRFLGRNDQTTTKTKYQAKNKIPKPL